MLNSFIGYLYLLLVQVREIGLSVLPKSLFRNAYNGHLHDGLFGHISARASDFKVNNNKNWICGKPRFKCKNF